eukprot:TRINITY_DN3437_c0_g1_i1.p1 TRINITY_DN3437_c0_g1~~TRINITY_DN3437_c0_g1_i1.p1  ORF type:complete len:213 (-),score=51.76 TRINITY_DN3437_c0_g1_i1:59-697(-)
MAFATDALCRLRGAKLVAILILSCVERARAVAMWLPAQATTEHRTSAAEAPVLRTSHVSVRLRLRTSPSSALRRNASAGVAATGNASTDAATNASNGSAVAVSEADSSLYGPSPFDSISNATAQNITGADAVAAMPRNESEVPSELRPANASSTGTGSANGSSANDSSQLNVTIATRSPFDIVSNASGYNSTAVDEEAPAQAQAQAQAQAMI